MTRATRPDLEPLHGRGVVLEPFAEHHEAELTMALARPEVFAGGYGGGPSGLSADPAGFRDFLHGYYSAPPRGATMNRHDYVVRLATSASPTSDAGGSEAGAVIGITTLGDFDEWRQSAHIGWTAYAPEVWGTPVNPATKLLLLGRAFDHGYERVKLQADAINERSRAAILKLGARFEGVLRHEQPRPDGSWRDTAVYSILAEEWPEVRAGLEARLDAAGA